MTLIELILVMATLSTVLAIASPKLSRFFAGRTSAEEARRFLSLTRYARSCAISASVPFKLWIDTRSGDYGLSPLTGYGFEDPKPVEITPDVGVSIEVDEKYVNSDGEAAIVFQPDGSIDPDGPEQIYIVEEDEGSIEIARTEDGFGFKILETSTDRETSAQ